MHIVWQQRPVKGRGGGPFLEPDPGERAAGYAPPWRDLRCEHHGGARFEWTPFLVQDERRDGQLRQQLLCRLPPIRSCCIEDEFRRAAWWHDVDWAIRLWDKLGDGPFADDLNHDRPTILADLRAVIRKPTPAGLRDFTAFRADHEAEDQARDAANQAYWTKQVRQDHPQGRRDHVRGGPDCFAVLGLKPDATLVRVKARHRELVMRHHPDRGGDPAKFREIQEAYEQAVEDLERRAAG